MVYLLYGGWLKLAPHHTNICKFSQFWGAVSSTVFNKSLSNLAIFLIFEGAGSMDFPKPVHVKSWKKKLLRGILWPRGQKPELREIWLSEIKSCFFSWVTFGGIAAYIKPPGLSRYARLVICWFHWWPRARIFSSASQTKLNKVRLHLWRRLTL